jgi:enterochelin esterase family protein
MIALVIEPLRVEDPEGRYAAVRLCSDLRLPDRGFIRDNGGWVLNLPAVRVQRLEYELETVDHDGSSTLILDPENPLRAPGAFGEKSVAVAGDYEPPWWLEASQAEGSFDSLSVRVLGQDLTISVWAPEPEGEMPLLIAHDGPEYDELAGLTRYAGAIIDDMAVAPFRVALLPPGDRDEWYSASAHYSRALCTRIVPALRDAVHVSGNPVGMGASLGGLAMLHAQRTYPGTFAALFMQSASFFMQRYDRHESGFPRYRRITRFVQSVLRADATPEALPVAMTCGAEEENVHNNRAMTAALSRQGYVAELDEVPDLHNYTGWRDAFDPYLTRLLEDW